MVCLLFKIFLNVSTKLYDFIHKEITRFLLDYSQELHHVYYYFKYYTFLSFMFHLPVLWKCKQCF